MPIENGIGYGEYTSVKIEHLQKILEMHMVISQAVIRKNASFYLNHYRYVDLTAGRGGTPDGNTGSPLVFLNIVNNPKSKFTLPFRADLIERVSQNIDELKNAVTAHAAYALDQGKINFFHDEYEKVIPELFHSRSEKELGIFYLDPSGDLPDYHTLAHISTVRPRMEILLYLSATNVKRQFQQTQKFLSDWLDQTKKQHWLIRKPFKGDSHQWTFLLGSKIDFFKPHKRIKANFCTLDSPEGREIFEKMNLSQDQRIENKQPRLNGF